MVLKGIALGGAIATVAVLVFAVLTFRPGASAAGAAEPAQAVNAVVLPNGMAAPQLQPGAAPTLMNDMSLLSLVGTARDNAAASAAQLSAASQVDSALGAKSASGCGGAAGYGTLDD